MWGEGSFCSSPRCPHNEYSSNGRLFCSTTKGGEGCAHSGFPSSCRVGKGVTLRRPHVSTQNKGEVHLTPNVGVLIIEKCGEERYIAPQPTFHPNELLGNFFSPTPGFFITEKSGGWLLRTGPGFPSKQIREGLFCSHTGLPND